MYRDSRTKMKNDSKSIPDSKVNVEINCNKCPNVIKHSIPLKEIFDSLQRVIPATKGPIESIYALIEQKKAMKLSSQCEPC